jgi:hypothetical protein
MSISWLLLIVPMGIVLPQVFNYFAGSGLGTAHRTLLAAISRKRYDDVTVV